ncbi:hypothetical protein AMATHDRAFT_7463 [Amanita thiersii Skay4041]|uniref:Ams2/SPT21 N-terminal domain-containing protein n=1 Tax=Amanita thiersii Skay4041 TaxID=703135 RepID=A0A2A9NBM7_9AGAR|nr:hypothetical protein AMATHDRAFT_7463 [Amanita thiersii Skay4041]
MASTSKLHLRILYTINSSPQYILARSHTLVPVIPVPQSIPVEASQLKYATVSLKTCLDTICRSSPELIQDNNRDYSVYVLDPLESNSAPAPMNISNSNANNKPHRAHDKQPDQPCGVAVGLGLMSWALLTDDSEGMVVTGTQIRLNTGQDALEVIFALRETVAMQRTSLSSTMRTWGLPPGFSSHTVHPSASTYLHSSASSIPNTISPSLTVGSLEPSGSQSTGTSFTASTSSLASIQNRNKTKSKAKKIPKPSTTPATESDKLMYSSETYIGPWKKKGRPRTLKDTKNASDTYEDSKASLGSVFEHKRLGASNNVKGADPTEETSAQVDVKLTIYPNQLQNPAGSLVSDTFAQPPYTTTDALQNDEETRSMIDFLTTIASNDALSAQNASLLAALSTIDSSTDNKEPNPALVNALRHLLSACVKQASQPMPIQPAHHPYTCNDTNNSTLDDDIVILDKENVDPLAFRKRNEKDVADFKINTPSSLTPEIYSETTKTTQSVLSQRGGTQANIAAGTGIKRKRTLSDFMDEKESERNREKIRERVRSERGEYRLSQSQTQKALALESRLSGLRHYPRLLTDESLPKPGTNSYYRTSHEAWSSPPRPKNMAGHTPSKKKRSVSSASSPSARACVSSPSRSTMGRESRKRYIVPEWARTNTSTRPRLSEEAKRALEEAEKKKAEKEAARKKAISTNKKLKYETSESKSKQVRRRASFEVPRLEPLAPVAAATNCPIFAASDTGLLPLSQSSSEQLTPPRSPTITGSLIVPQTPPQKRPMSMITPRTPERSSSSLFTPTPKARHSQASGGAGSPLFTPGNGSGPWQSPLGHKARNSMSPIQAIISGRYVDGADSWCGTGSDHEKGDSDADFPLNLPTASSDVEDETLTSSTVRVEHTDDDDIDKDKQFRIKQIWDGLPPSSPPPPTSPILSPQDDDDDAEVTDLPVPTSDIDESRDTEPEVDGGMRTGVDMFDSLFSTFMNPLEKTGSSNVDIFSPLGTEDKIKDENATELEASLEPIFQSGLADFDFTEFWESFKPMVEEHVGKSDVYDMGVSEDHGERAGTTSSLDHCKLAEDMHALFSGCLM